MVELQKNLKAISATGYQVVAVSYDSVEILKKFSDSSSITFPLLSDPGSATIRAYGIHNQKGLPHPGTYLIGKDRKVKAAMFNEGYRKRHTSEELISAIQNLAP